MTERTAFLEAQAITAGVIRRYNAETIDRVHLVYNRFKSAMDQYVDEQIVLPIQEELTSLYTPEGAGEHMDFAFEPSPEAVLDDLLPSYIEISIYRAILEGMASEHGARMTAMRAASDAATRHDRRVDPGDEPGAAVLHHPGDPGSGGRGRRTVWIGGEKAMNKGKIVEIIGPVLDVEFPDDLPAIYNALVLDVDTPSGHIHLVAEVQQHLGDNKVRAVAMDSTDGLARGMEVDRHR